MRGKRIAMILVGLSLWLPAGSIAAQAVPKLLPEGVAMLGVDGTIVGPDANDFWVFQVGQDVNDPGVQLVAGTELPLLVSATLETMLADANDRRAPRYRLSGQVTRYRGKNYLLPSYYLPLSTFKDVNEPVASDVNAPSPDDMTVAGTEQGDPNLAIPPEVLEVLNQRRIRPGPRRRAPDPNAPLKPPTRSRGRIIVDRIGFIEPRDGRATFVPDALGWNVSTEHYGLLPCVALEEAERMLEALPDPVRFKVAGLVTEFKGRKYLLLQRAARVYSHGNFGQ